MTPQPHLDVHRIALAIVVAVNLLAYWYPFKLDLPRRIDNTARRSADGALEVDPWSRVQVTPPVGTVVADTPGGWAVEIEAHPARLRQTGPARLVDTADDPYQPGFALAVDGDDFIVRMRCRDGQTGAEWRLPIEYGPGSIVAVTLRQTGQGAHPELVFRGGSPASLDSHCGSGHLVPPFSPREPWSIGNVASGHRPFEGRIAVLRLTAGDKTVDLLRRGEVEIPAAFWLLPERYFQAGQADASTILAATWHVAGFLVLGWLLASGPQRMGPGSAFLAAMGIAVILNAGKLLVAGRHTEVEDLLLNAAGAVLGILSAHLVVRRRSRAPRLTK